MLRQLRRWQALVALCLLAAGVLAILSAPPAAPTPLEQRPYTDIDLYSDIVSGMQAGGGYYQTATRLQRAHDYPTVPFVTVRQPTLASMIAAIGWDNARYLLAAILAVGAIAWLGVLNRAALAERIGAMFAWIAAAIPVLAPEFIRLHEFWAGALAALSLAIARTRLWPVALVTAGLGSAIRELSVPLLGVLALSAAWRRDKVQAAAWLGLIALFAAGMAAHAFAVQDYAMPGDGASQGWTGLRGPLAPLQDLAEATLLRMLPLQAAMIVLLLALAGLAAMPARGGREALLYCLTIGLLVACFARPINTYWAQLAMPVLFIGIAFIPRALRDLVFAAGAKRDDRGTPATPRRVT